MTLRNERVRKELMRDISDIFRKEVRGLEGVVSIDNSTIKKNGSKQIYVDSLNVNKLTQTEGDTLILYCGEVN